MNGQALFLTFKGLGLRGAQSVISMVNVVLLAHALGPDGRGEYFLFVAALAVLARVVDLGMSPSAVVFASKYPGWLRALQLRLAAMLLGLWLFALVFGVVILSAFNPDLADLPRARQWLALGVLPFAMYEQVWVHLMVGIRRVVGMNVVQTGAALATLALNVTLVVFRPGGVDAAVLIYCGVIVAKTPLMAALAWRFTGSDEVRSDPLSLRQILSFSVRGYPNALAALAWSRLPAFVLDAAHGPAAVGLFSVAQQVLEQLILPVQAAQDAIYQELAQLNPVQATAAMNRYLRTALWSMLPLVILSGLVASWGVPVVFGQPFQGSAPVLQILLVSLLASVVPVLLSPYFFGQLQRPGLASTVAWIRVLLALVLSLMLAAPLAEVGVAIALAIADVCSTVLILVVYGRMAATPLSSVVLLRGSDVGMLVRKVWSRAQADQMA